MKTSLAEICPYGGAAVSDTRDDHIFSKFLGGRRMIGSCVPCNNGFGKSFEGTYSE